MQEHDPDEVYTFALECAGTQGLVVSAYGGMATIANHDIQKEMGWFERCQWMAGLGEHPKTINRRAKMNKTIERINESARKVPEKIYSKV